MEILIDKKTGVVIHREGDKHVVYEADSLEVMVILIKLSVPNAEAAFKSTWEHTESLGEVVGADEPCKELDGKSINEAYPEGTLEILGSVEELGEVQL